MTCRHRVGSVRRVNGIHGYRSAKKNGEWLTMRDAAAKLGVSHHQVRKLIKAGVLLGISFSRASKQSASLSSLGLAWVILTARRSSGGLPAMACSTSNSAPIRSSASPWRCSIC